MTLNEAIKIKEEELKWYDSEGEPEAYQAAAMSIEALKRVKATRNKKFPVMGEELPGETE